MSVTKKYKEDLVTGAAIRDGKGRNIANQLDGKHPTIDADHPLAASLVSGLPKGNVQSDWNATSGDAQILNKPTLFSGSYNDLTNKPTIPTIPTSLPANGGNAATVNGHTVNADVPADAKFTDTVVQADWNATSGAAVILNKPFIVNSSNQLCMEV